MVIFFKCNHRYSRSITWVRYLYSHYPQESGNALCRYSLKYRGNRLRENIIPVEWYCLYYTTGYNISPLLIISVTKKMSVIPLKRQQNKGHNGPRAYRWYLGSGQYDEKQDEVPSSGHQMTTPTTKATVEINPGKKKIFKTDYIRVLSY